MFTGIINAIGSIKKIIDHNGDKSFTIDTGDMDIESTKKGESICVNGACLTIVSKTNNTIEVDVSCETLSCTNFKEYVEGNLVNLERAVQASDRLNGHIVNGHIDCVGEVVSIISQARSTRYIIEMPFKFQKYICVKGSVCIDGVSLTINNIKEQKISINIIPYTKANTIFSEYISGTNVNIEIDLIARYLEMLNKYKK